MDIYQHVPGKRDFLIEEKDVSVTEFRGKPSAVWKYVETPGHVVFFTRRGKRICVLMSIETHACLSDDYDAEMTEVEREAQAYREKRKPTEEGKRSTRAEVNRVVLYYRRHTRRVRQNRALLRKDNARPG